MKSTATTATTATTTKKKKAATKEAEVQTTPPRPAASMQSKKTRKQAKKYPRPEDAAKGIDDYIRHIWGNVGADGEDLGGSDSAGERQVRFEAPIPEEWARLGLVDPELPDFAKTRNDPLWRSETQCGLCAHVALSLPPPVFERLGHELVLTPFKRTAMSYRGPGTERLFVPAWISSMGDSDEPVARRLRRPET